MSRHEQRASNPGSYRFAIAIGLAGGFRRFELQRNDAVSARWSISVGTRDLGVALGLGKNLSFEIHAWESRHWFSSSLSDDRAENLRGPTCRDAQSESDAGSVPWLRRLHASHGGGPGPFSLCVHREDVKTLSYSEVMVTPEHVQMGHFRGSPCTMAQIQRSS